jgi:hypothetical protein
MTEQKTQKFCLPLGITTNSDFVDQDLKRILVLLGAVAHAHLRYVEVRDVTRA